MSIRSFFLLPAVLLAALFMACSSGDDGPLFPEQLVLNDDYKVLPVLANSEIVVGENRIALGLLDHDDNPIVDANVHLVFYDLNDGKEVKKFEMDAESTVPARDAGLTEQVEHVHTDGSRHVHVNVTEATGVYVANVDFERAGTWGMEIRVDSKSPKIKETLRPRFTVAEQGTAPMVGSKAPLSQNLTVDDVTDISQIDSSSKPSREMHTSTIAEAVAAGKPTLVLFAVPGYCSTKFCGPELEIMRSLYPQYSAKAEFIHVEFYSNPSSADRQPVETVREWNLRSEPWFFVIDSSGTITARFEGPTSKKELEDALKKVVSTS